MGKKWFFDENGKSEGNNGGDSEREEGRRETPHGMFEEAKSEEEAKDTHAKMREKAQELVNFADKLPGGQIYIMGAGVHDEGMVSFHAGICTPPNRARLLVQAVKSLGPVDMLLFMKMLESGSSRGEN